MKRTRLQRDRVIALITREVRRFMKLEEEQIVDDLLSYGVSWCSNSRNHTINDLARALIALLAVAPVEDLEHVADTAIWHRELLGSDYSDRAKLDAARHTARRILAPLGVRYAACGCLKQCAGDRCCDAAMAAAEARRVS